MTNGGRPCGKKQRIERKRFPGVSQRDQEFADGRVLTSEIGDEWCDVVSGKELGRLRGLQGNCLVELAGQSPVGREVDKHCRPLGLELRQPRGREGLPRLFALREIPEGKQADCQCHDQGDAAGLPAVLPQAP